MPSLTQRVLLRVMGSRAEAMERDSRAWIVTCPNCGLEQSIWDLGGIRYGAKSKGKRMGVKCRGCGERGLHTVERRPEQA